MFESGKRNLKRVGRKEDFLRGEGSARHAEKVEFFPESKSESASPRRKTFQLYSLDHVQRRLAIVDDDEGILAYLEDILSQSGFQVQCFKNAESFLMKLEASVDSKQGLVDVILCDVRLPGKDGHTLLGDLKEKSPDIPLILMTAFAEVEMVVQAIRDGAFDYLEKPFDSTRLVSILENALRFRRLSYENKFLKNIVDPDIQLQGVQCQSPSMKAVYDLIKRVAPTDSSVLITGESGVGKEIVARAIHDNSSRSEKPFISINCSAIPESLLESELFGHTRGSFTGATHHRKGLFEEADGGTLFLDEIGDLKFSLQAKLLRVFQEKRIRAIGDNDFRVVDVRILTATHKDLPEEIRANRFREDLYYRLNVIPIHIPPHTYRIYHVYHRTCRGVLPFGLA